jgi:hypothetical protein
MFVSFILKRAYVYFSTSISSSALPLFCVQHPLQSLLAHSSYTVATIVCPVLGSLRHKSWSWRLLKSGNTETMLWDMTQLSD